LELIPRVSWTSCQPADKMTMAINRPMWMLVRRVRPISAVRLRKRIAQMD
jgi:hypothetical protein